MDPKQPHDQTESQPLTVLPGRAEVDGDPEKPQPGTVLTRLEADPASLTGEQIEHLRRVLKLQREQSELRGEEAANRTVNATAAVIEAAAACESQRAAQLGHDAEEASHRAAKGPERQDLALQRERTTQVMAVVLTVFGMAFVTYAAISRPWMIPTGAVVAGAMWLVRRWLGAQNPGG